MQSDIYRLITEQLADAVIHSDVDGIIRGWNAAAERHRPKICAPIVLLAFSRLMADP